MHPSPDGQSPSDSGYVDKLVIDLGGVGTVDRFLATESKLKGGGLKAPSRQDIQELLLQDDEYSDEGMGSCCFDIFSCCNGSGYDGEEFEPDDFEWADEMDDNRSMTSAGARSAFTGASKRSDRQYPQQPRRKDRYDDNMSVASSSVSRPGASHAKRNNRDSDYDNRSGAGSRSSSSQQRQSKPSRALGQVTQNMSQFNPELS